MLTPRALYIGPQADVHLDLGPSLRITQAGHAPVRIPLAGIARAIVHHHARVPLHVLTALASAGVPVVLAGGGMEALAICTRAQRLPCDPSWDARLARLWAQDGWRERYANWLAAQERLAIRTALARLGAPCHDLRPQTARRILAAPLAEAGVGSWLRSRTEKAWRACLAAWIVQALREQGLAPDLLDRPMMGWHLLHDLVDLLLWDMRLHAAMEAGRWAKCARRLEAGNEPEGFRFLRRQWFAAFEQRRPRLEKLLNEVLRRFVSWLAEVERCAG